MGLERERASERQFREEFGLVEETQGTVDVAVVGESVLDHNDREMLKRRHHEVARGEGTIEIIHAVAVDDYVQAPDARGVVCDCSLESLDALLVHIDREGDVELHAPRSLHETLGGAKVVVLVDGGPERRRA